MRFTHKLLCFHRQRLVLWFNIYSGIGLLGLVGPWIEYQVFKKKKYLVGHIISFLMHYGLDSF